MGADDVNVEKKSSLQEVPPAKPIQKRWKSNQLLSLFALLISLGTFITFAYQNYLIQKQQYRSVLPYLMISSSSGYDELGQLTLALVIYNNGVGPAFVEDLSISYEGKSYSNISDFYFDAIYPIKCGRTEIKKGYALPAGQTFPILTSNDSTAAKALEKVIQNIHIELSYSSLYDEKWKTIIGDKSQYKPVKLD